MEEITYPKYYRKLGRCIRRMSDTNGREVRTPDNIKEMLPLMIDNVVFPTKQRFDEEIAKMELVDQECWEHYINVFTTRVCQDIEEPMKKIQLARAIAKLNTPNLTQK